MLDIVKTCHTQYTKIVTTFEGAVESWLPGLLARFTFLAVLFVYFMNSALTKFDGGIFSVSDSAYFQIIPPIVEAADYDASQVSFIPWGAIVYLGTYAEIILPVLIVVGLFTRLAALGMIGFTLVQSYVDIAFHGVEARTIGAWFDNLSGAVILDQRAFWVFLFLYLAIKGAGLLSLDALLSRYFAGNNSAS